MFLLLMLLFNAVAFHILPIIWAIFLFRYLRAKGRCKRGEPYEEELQEHKRSLIVTSAILGVCIAVFVICAIILNNSSISFM